MTKRKKIDWEAERAGYCRQAEAEDEEKEGQALFEELRKLIPAVGGLAKNYPALFRLYLKVATPERMKGVKST